MHTYAHVHTCACSDQLFKESNSRTTLSVESCSFSPFSFFAYRVEFSYYAQRWVSLFCVLLQRQYVAICPATKIVLQQKKWWRTNIRGWASLLESFYFVLFLLVVCAIEMCMNTSEKPPSSSEYSKCIDSMLGLSLVYCSHVPHSFCFNTLPFARCLWTVAMYGRLPIHQVLISLPQGAVMVLCTWWQPNWVRFSWNPWG